MTFASYARLNFAPDIITGDIPRLRPPARVFSSIAAPGRHNLQPGQAVSPFLRAFGVRRRALAPNFQYVVERCAERLTPATHRWISTAAQVTLATARGTDPAKCPISKNKAATF